MPRTNEQFTGIRETRRQHILDTALELFAIEGYHTTSIRKIASTAGISKGLLYNYFESKEDLVRSIIHKGIDQMMSVFDQNKDGFLTDQEMEFFVNENFKIIRQNIPFWQLYYATLLQPAVSKMVIEEYKEHLPELRMILINYFRHKGLPHPEMEALYFSALFEGLIMNFVLDPKYFPIDQMKDYLLNKLNILTANTPDQ
jgi:AcrR family transcriptional regulator